MQTDFLAYDDIQSRLLEWLNDRGYSTVSMTAYRYLSNGIFRMMKAHGYQEYCKEGGALVLREYLKQNTANQHYSHLKTVVCRLDDLLDDNWSDRHGLGRRKYRLNSSQTAAIKEYCSFCESAGRKAGTIIIKKDAASWFLHEMTKLGCFDMDGMTPELVARACIEVMDHNLWGEIRRFLRYLSDEGILPADYSTAVPHYRKPYVIPSIYSEEEVSHIEMSIDRQSVIGKRDYAMVLLASRMGLRSGDIASLRMEDVDFENRTLYIVQQKTGRELRLPLVEDVGHAILDYLTARPQSNKTQIFLTACAPYKPVSTGCLRYAMRKYISEAGIAIGNRKKGPHVLRSSLASSMVNDSVPYETVRRILGHSSDNAIKHYARIDIERLRPYCLIPPQPTGSFREFLGMRTEG